VQIIKENTFSFISIIIPIYNEELYIEACIESIVLSDYPTDKLELLLIDMIR